MTARGAVLTPQAITRGKVPGRDSVLPAAEIGLVRCARV